MKCRIAKYYESLADLPVTSISQPGDVKGLIPQSPPSQGEPFEVISEDFEKLILPGITHWQHPSFFALYPANSTFESIIADMYSAAVNSPGFNWTCSPIATDLEFVMMDWVAELLGLGGIYKSTSKTGGGTIVGTASEACLTVAVAARERALSYEAMNSLNRFSTKESSIRHKTRATLSTNPGSRSDLSTSARADLAGRMVVYGSTETHSMGHKSAIILGLQWRPLPVTKEDGWRLRGETLRKALEADVAKGLIPCMLIATLGTTNVGAMDCLDELTEVAKDYPTLWIHVDAAWAGVYLSLPEHRGRLYLDIINQPDKGFEMSHMISSDSIIGDKQEMLNVKQLQNILKTAPGTVNSFCTNFHKSGLVSFDCSTFFIRDKGCLTEALELTPHYLRSKEGETDAALDFRNWSIPLGRRFRSLKIFFVLRSFGVQGFQRELRSTIDLTNYFDKLVKEDDWFESIQDTTLALTIFRMKPSLNKLNKDCIFWNLNLKEQEIIINNLNQRLAIKIQATNKISVTNTFVDNRFCFRIAIGRMSKKSHIEQAWKLFKDCSENLKREFYRDNQTSMSDRVIDN
ncbi:hypothetical protein CROQUDRAFT_726201 [Cronartium quercuum f. sp. fusiforme G11]|uniref:Aromatic-L-amino-acid decarboxylase n=1 Tax=Cronartium quercuum f. sp. fusiforme G11 TaxID=708437 RepID=A0A9P6N6A3_9BASI|nr:hypothetical protein CROQUDRAFT_726201 [Cronartium quercuum f. sp. fusiforme G11]